MKKIICVAILLVLMFGCGDKSISIHPTVIRVSNLSTIAIFPELHSNNTKEDFGVVAIGTSATKGFGPFNPNETILVRCIEDGGRKILKSTIDSSFLVEFNGKVKLLNFIYEGDNTWILKAFDENDKELIVINGVKLERLAE